MTSLRRLYETPKDREAEQTVIDALCKRWHCEWWKLPLHYQLDYALTSEDDKVKAWLEIKCRAKKQDIKLSLHKVMAGLELSRVTGLPFLLAVAFGDEIYWREVKQERFEIVMWGRVDRNDWQDTEPTAVFPLKEFKPF
jgi:hypothetical protein